MPVAIIPPSHIPQSVPQRRNRILPLVFSLLLLACQCLRLYAQHTTVTGTVIDAERKERLPFASVVVEETRNGAQTNLEGFFVLHNAPDTTFVLLVSYVGYASTEIAVDPVEGTSQGLIVKLRPSVIGLEGVTVTGAQSTFLKTEKTPSVTTISPKQLAGLPAVGQADIFRSLQLLPGISATNDNASGLSVRGGTPDQNLVLFDGMTVYQVDHFFGFFSAFNPDAIKDLRIYKGAFPAMYGGRLSSVVDIVGRTGNPDHLHGKFGLSLLSADALIEVPLFGANVLVAARRSYTDIVSSGAYNTIYKLLTGSEAPGSGGGGQGGGFGRFGAGVSQQTVPTSSFSDLNAKLSFHITPRFALSVSYFGSGDDYDLARSTSIQNIPGFEGSFNVPSRSSNTQQGNNGASAKLFAQWSDNLYSDIVLAYNGYSSAFVSNASAQNPNAPRFATDEQNSIDDATLRIDNTWSFSTHDIGFGAEFTSTAVQYTLTGTDPAGTSRDLFQQDQHGWVNAAYVQDSWALSPAMQFVGGLRLSNYSVSHAWYLEPRASLRYELFGGMAVKAAWGMHSQFVNRILNENVTEGSRDFWILSDDAVLPGKANHYVAGASWENDMFNVDVEGFYKDLSNVSEFTQRFRRQSTDLYTFLNGSGRVRGVEFLVQKKTGVFSGWISYTLSKAEKRFPEIEYGQYFPSENDQTHELKLIGSFNPGDDWTIAATFVFATGKPYTAPISQYTLTLLDSTVYNYTHVSGKNAYRLPDYHRLDLSVSKKFRWTNTALSLGVSVFNVYNRTNISYYQYELNTQPVIVTQVAGLGILPTVVVQLEF